MNKNSTVINVLCGLWLVFCMICGTIALLLIGIDSVLGGLAVFMAGIIIGVLPFILAEAFREDDFNSNDYDAKPGKEPGILAMVFLGIAQCLKIVFIVVIGIVTFGCMLCAGKTHDGLK